MSTIKKMTLAGLALGAGLALAPFVHAQDTSGASQPKKPDMMDHSAMKSGGDMSAMMKMMENCNRMMQTMNSHSPQDPSAPATPGKGG